METIKLHITGVIRITGLEKKEREHVKKTLQLPNPLWHKLKAMGSPAIYATPKEFKYFRTLDDGTLIVPRGFRSRLIGWLEKMKREYVIEELFIKKSL